MRAAAVSRTVLVVNCELLGGIDRVIRGALCASSTCMRRILGVSWAGRFAAATSPEQENGARVVEFAFRKLCEFTLREALHGARQAKLKRFRKVGARASNGHVCA